MSTEEDRASSQSGVELECCVYRLAEIAHELSNSVGMTMNSLVLSAIADKDRSGEFLGEATENAIRATGSLRMLMLELSNLREIAQQSNMTSDRSESPPTEQQRRDAVSPFRFP